MRSSVGKERRQKQKPVPWHMRRKKLSEPAGHASERDGRNRPHLERNRTGPSKRLEIVTI
jgi:hypothetical protein